MPPSVPRTGSPIDHMPTPDRLSAKVVRPGARPLLHGYDLQRDLSVNYDGGELALIALSGEAPSEIQSSRFSVTSAFAAGVSAAHAPVHAALLARRYGSRDSGVASVAAIGLTELARFELDGQAELLTWLAAGGESDPPASAAPASDDDAAASDRLREALRSRGCYDRRLDAELGLLPAVVTSLHACGLTQRWQLEAAFTWARLPVAIAEAMAHDRGDLKTYPINVPPFSLGE